MRFGEFQALHHGAHGAIQNQNALSQQVGKRLGAGVGRKGHAAIVGSQASAFDYNAAINQEPSMSDHQHSPESEDVVEAIVPLMPVVLPIAGGVLIFLLAFIAVFMG
jgi:hypothetical protein